MIVFPSTTPTVASTFASRLNFAMWDHRITDGKSKAQRGEVTKSSQGQGLSWSDVNMGPQTPFSHSTVSLGCDPAPRVKRSPRAWVRTCASAPVGAAEWQSKCQKSLLERGAGGGAAALQSQGAVGIAVICIHLFNILLVSPFSRQED